MNRKRALAAVLTMICTLGALAGCTGGTQDTSSASEGQSSSSAVSSEVVSSSSSEAEGQAAPVPADGILMGLAVSTDMRESKSAAEGELGYATIESTIAAVLVDADGRIVDCVIDGVESEGDFDAVGAIQTDLTTRPMTKNELGTNYGMASASGIGKEWNEQVAALAQYVIGKTAEEVSGLSVTEDGKAADAELSASMTMYIPPYLELIAKAAQTATYHGAVAGNRLGLGSVTHLADSRDAGERDGQIMAYSYYVAASVDDAGAVTGAIIDSTQGTVSFDAAGQITSDVRASVSTKNEIGADYGMAQVSPLGLEWNVQMQNFAAYVKGKTIEEINGIAVDDEQRPTDPELSAGVSISLGDIRATLVKAIENAAG